MPMHDLGYRGWDADAPHLKYSWMSISRYGRKIAWKSQWLKRVVWFAYLPFFGLLGAVFFYEQASNWPQVYPVLVTVVETLEETQEENTSEQYPEDGRQQMESIAQLIQKQLEAAGEDAGSAPEVLEHLERALEEIREVLEKLEKDQVPAGEDALQARIDPGTFQDPEKFVQDYVDEHRSNVWRAGFYSFFRRSQGILMVLLVGMIAPGLISRDRQSRAFLLYFSRPITPFQYLLGKATTVWIFLMAVTTVPALVVYLVGVLFSPGLGVILDTWDIPLRILLATAVLTIPTTMLALCLSSLVNESRYARFSWFAIWIVGFISANILGASDFQASGEFDIWTSRWACLSLYHVLGIVERWVFGLMKQPADVIPYLAILGTITVVCYGIVMRRITAPIRV